MKGFKAITTAIISLFCAHIFAQDSKQGAFGDNIRLSLLTCAPSSTSYFLYGHSALRVTDYESKQDFVVNYGAFDWSTSNFIPKFTLGIMDYCMEIEPYDLFCAIYSQMGRRVIEQDLNLTPKEKGDIMNMLAENYKPENRKYRYNILYDNCTSRLRDIIESHANGKIEYKPMDETPSMRELLHKFNEEYRWECFGVDLLLGVQADKPLSRKLCQFLPYNLMNDFDGAEIIGEDGSIRALVAEKKTVIAGNESISMEKPQPIPPTACFLILLAITIYVTTNEYLKKKKTWWYDALLMAICGITGTVLFIMLFSDHPTVRINFQILILNPLALFFIRRMIKRTRSNQPDWQHKMWTVFIILFFIGGFFQNYAEGMYLVALSLLIRNMSKLYFKPLYK